MCSALIAQFQSVYNTLNKDRLSLLDTIYSEDITFTDPFHHVKGLPELKNYFKKLYMNVDSCQFLFEAPCIANQQAYISWEMQLKHPRLNKGNIISVRGCTQLRFQEKIYYHRDYFDAGNMLYENIPVLNNIISYVKRKL